MTTMDDEGIRRILIDILETHGGRLSVGRLHKEFKKHNPDFDEMDLRLATGRLLADNAIYITFDQAVAVLRK